MSKKQIKKIIVTGIIWVLCLIAGIVYSLLYNEGRWVKEMSLNDYVFSVKDIPMLAVGVMIALWVLYVVVVTFKTVFKALIPLDNYILSYTRKIPPFLGVFGICGFLGFSGFWTYSEYSIISPFLFFTLFGVFGLFFEGKLSHTLEDELFQQNKTRADLKSYKTGFVLLVIVILLSRWRIFALNAEWCAIFLLISVSLIVALVLFQKNYLLYCYEKEE